MVEKSLGMRSPEASETDVAASSPSSSSKSSLALQKKVVAELLCLSSGAFLLVFDLQNAGKPPVVTET